MRHPSIDFVQFADDGMMYNFNDVESPLDLVPLPPESGLEYNHSKSGWIKRHGLWERSLKFVGIQYNPADKSQSDNQGGTLSTTTRTPKDYTFEDSELIRRASQYDGEWIHTPEGVHRCSLAKWFESVYHSWVVSRIYQGILSSETITQDFTLYYKSSSWLELELLRAKGALYKLNGEINPKLTLYNVSSFATANLAGRIDRYLLPASCDGFRDKSTYVGDCESWYSPLTDYLTAFLPSDKGLQS